MEPERNVIPMPVNEPVQHLNSANSAPPHLVDVSANANSIQTELEEVGNIGKIRDILFGTQMRDYDKRFARLEERLLKESNEMRIETQRRFESLEGFIKTEFSALTDRLKTENRQRDEMGEALSGKLQETAKQIERKVAQLDEQTAQAQRELREQLLEQSKALSEEIRRKHDELALELAREATELRDEKTDRAALADLFTEVALRLNHKFHLPNN